MGSGVLAMQPCVAHMPRQICNKLVRSPRTRVVQVHASSKRHGMMLLMFEVECMTDASSWTPSIHQQRRPCVNQRHLPCTAALVGGAAAAGVAIAPQAARAAEAGSVDGAVSSIVEGIKVCECVGVVDRGHTLTEQTRSIIQQAAGEIVKQGIELGNTAVDKAKDAYDVVRTGLPQMHILREQD